MWKLLRRILGWGDLAILVFLVLYWLVVLVFASSLAAGGYPYHRLGEALGQTLKLIGLTLLVSALILIMVSLLTRGQGAQAVSALLQFLSCAPLFILAIFLVYQEARGLLWGALILSLGDFAMGEMLPAFQHNLRQEFAGEGYLKFTWANGIAFGWPHRPLDLYLRKMALALKYYGYPYLKHLLHILEAKLPFFLGGSIIVEYAFSLPDGLGSLALKASGLVSRFAGEKNGWILLVVIGLFQSLIFLFGLLTRSLENWIEQ